MRIGVCASPERWKIVADAGYDYVEGSFSKIALASDEEFEEMKKTRAESGLDVEAANGFFPSDFVIYSKDNFEEIEQSVRDYVERGFSRGRELGMKVTVLGSSKARNIREDYTKQEAEEQFLKVLRICGEVGAKYGIAVTVEPLNPLETNFINTYAEGLEISRKADCPNVLSMIDFYHHAVNGEPIATLDGTKGVLVHAHIARADRNTPTLDDIAELAPKVEYLKNTGYEGRMSLECRHVPDFETSVKNAYELLKQFR